MILAANSSFPTRVAVYTPHRKPAGYLIRVGARAGGSDDRKPSRASILSIVVNLPANQSAPVSTPLGRVIASILPVWRRLATRILERCEPLTSVRILVAAFSRYAGQRRLICKIRRPQQAAGKPFSRFLRALRVRQNLARQGTDLLHYNQTLSFVPTNHAHKKTWSNEHVAHEKSVKGA